jgi:hypothetical protein
MDSKGFAKSKYRLKDRIVSTFVSKSCVYSKFSDEEQNAACNGNIGEYRLSKDHFAPYT